MKVTTIRRLSRGVAAMALATVLALPVVAVEPPAASLLAWSGVVCIVVGLAAGLRGAIDAGLLLLLVRYAAVLAFTSAVDPLVWAKAGATVALIDLAHGSLEAVYPAIRGGGAGGGPSWPPPSPPPRLEWWSWAPPPLPAGSSSESSPSGRSWRALPFWYCSFAAAPSLR